MSEINDTETSVDLIPLGGVSILRPYQTKGIAKSEDIQVNGDNLSTVFLCAKTPGEP